MTEGLYKVWGRNLQNMREFRGLARWELADALEVTRATVSRWEAGQFAPSDALKLDIADVFRVPAMAIFPLVRVPS
jgi:DNA-binding XRE family transcriptional regulator